MVLEFTQMEVVYEELAQALDSVEEQDRQLFLCKLCLMLARESHDPTGVREMIRTARNNLRTN